MADPIVAPSTDRLVEEAARWLVRLDGTAEATGERAAFAAWLRSDPRHAPAFAEAQRLWAAIGGPAAELATVSRRRQRRALLVGGAALVAMAGAGTWAGLRGPHPNLVTGAGARRSATLADGSRIELDTDTAVVVAMDLMRRQVDLLRGRVFLEVAPDPARPLGMRLAGGELRVLGTAFSASDRDGAGTVAVTHGRVRLAGHTEARDLAPGEAAELRHGVIGRTRPFDPEIDMAWRHGRLVVDRRPLGEVVAELARYRRGRIVLLDGAVAARPVTGVFRTDDTDAAIAVIEGTLGLTAWRLPGLVILR